MNRFTIRELLVVTLLVASISAWWVNRSRISNELKASRAAASQLSQELYRKTGVNRLGTPGLGEAHQRYRLHSIPALILLPLPILAMIAIRFSKREQIQLFAVSAIAACWWFDCRRLALTLWFTDSWAADLSKTLSN